MCRFVLMVTSRQRLERVACVYLEEDGVADAACMTVLKLLKGLSHLTHQRVIMRYTAHNGPQCNLHATHALLAALPTTALTATCKHNDI